ncbi:MAG: hypothetical protein PWQ68_1618 [Thermoanaerobacteraceae bacterium]|nr:hypothetical protein [Thermoanaerobacteraceae bacterium]
MSYFYYESGDTLEVLIVSPISKDGGGGVASHVISHQKSLLKKGINSKLVVIEPSYGTFYFYLWAGARKIINKIWQPNGFRFIDTMRKVILMNILRNMDPLPNIIHCHSLYVDILKGILKKRNLNIPIVLTVHGYISDEAVSRGTIKRNSKGYRYLLNQESRLFSMADKIICVDTRLAQHVSELCRDKEPFILRNVVDTEIFKPMKKSENKDKINVLCPRMLNPKNGVIIAIKAIEIYIHKKPHTSIQLLIAGDGKQRKELETYVRENNLSNVVKFLGLIHHSQMPKLISSSDVVIIPSIPHEGVEEATSIAALESMSCGVPVVASNIGGLKEIITDGIDGFLVPPNEPHLFANAIEQAILNKKTISIQSRKSIEKKYSLEVMGENLIKIYNELLN